MYEETSNKRRPVMKRKGGMEVVIAVGAKPKMKPPEPSEDEGYEDDMCQCPECGHKFVPGENDNDSEEED